MLVMPTSVIHMEHQSGSYIFLNKNIANIMVDMVMTSTPL